MVDFQKIMTKVIAEIEALAAKGEPLPQHIHVDCSEFGIKNIVFWLV
jgi:hypothetical protein